ncbi:hypothetical protein FIBSPDRAFT_925726 [Athelia psychrophila]|uniref:Uncharacterized protein n=1 Tax=Athelia psychrophila TaxID=1759441 RepID=A0A166U9R1_9AGAM|nr:hypothetical protein FIBSPDRAFT_925726 [Fibularhizoctonia sp. CBS 109695]
MLVAIGETLALINIDLPLSHGMSPVTGHLCQPVASQLVAVQCKSDVLSLKINSFFSAHGGAGCYHAKCLAVRSSFSLRNVKAHERGRNATLARNSLASTAIRELVIYNVVDSEEFPQQGEFFQIFYRLITLALQQTCYLKTLNILLPLNREWCYILDDVFLPNLLDLSLIAKNTSDLASFLNRHPEINRLQLLCQAHDCYLHMPALFSFTGLYSMVPNIAASSPFINQLGITWEDATDEEYDDTLKSLALSPLVISKLTVWHTGTARRNRGLVCPYNRMVPVYGRIMYGLYGASKTRQRIRAKFSQAAAGTATIRPMIPQELKSLADVLPTLKNLRALDCKRFRSTDGLTSLELGIVKAWGKACKTANNHWRKMMGLMGFWLPEGDFEEAQFQELAGLILADVGVER